MMQDQPAPDDENPHEQIARLEARIESLADQAERCGRIMAAAQVAAALGAALLLALLFRLIRFDPLAMIGGMTAVLGGIVAYGSNASTARQARAAIAEAEALRRALIGRIGLETVPAPAERRLLH